MLDPVAEFLAMPMERIVADARRMQQIAYPEDKPLFAVIERLAARTIALESENHELRSRRHA